MEKEEEKKLGQKGEGSIEWCAQMKRKKSEGLSDRAGKSLFAKMNTTYVGTYVRALARSYYLLPREMTCTTSGTKNMLLWKTRTSDGKADSISIINQSNNVNAGLENEHGNY